MRQQRAQWLRGVLKAPENLLREHEDTLNAIANFYSAGNGPRFNLSSQSNRPYVSSHDQLISLVRQKEGTGEILRRRPATDISCGTPLNLPLERGGKSGRLPFAEAKGTEVVASRFGNVWAV